MAAWFEGMFGAEFGSFAMWTIIALISVAALIIVIWIAKQMLSGTFVAGGRSRKPRLAVLDAAAVDTRRRIVLVRRDDTEHLILIGGPTDVVIEQGIKSPTPTARPAGKPAETERKLADKSEKTAAPRNSTGAAPETKRRENASIGQVEPTGAVPAATKVTQRDPLARTSASGVTAAPIPLPTEAARELREPSAMTAASTKASDRYKTDPTAPALAAQTSRPERTPEPMTGPAADKGDLDTALLKELETTLDRPKSTDAGSEKADIDDDMAKMIAEMGRERA